jgi:hypothetical protein
MSIEFRLRLYSEAQQFLPLSSSVGVRKSRALKSAAISDLDSKPKVFLKLSLKPRTPTSAATPTATESTTNPNFPGADFKSRHAMAPPAASSMPA